MAETSESPDFEQLTRDVITEAAGQMAAPERTLNLAFGTIHRALVSVWNARGAADIAKAELLTEAADLVVETLRGLDR